MASSIPAETVNKRANDNTEIPPRPMVPFMPESPAGSSVGPYIVYSRSKRLAGVPLTDGSFRRITPSRFPADVMHRFSQDYVSAFVDIFGDVARESRGGSVASTVTSSERPVVKEPNLTKFAAPPAQSPEKRRPGRPKKLRSPDGQESVPKRPAPVRVPAVPRERPAAVSSARTSSERSSTPPLLLPERQSERTIRAKLLNNAVLNDDLGIGIDDDANQRRSWHKPRVHPVMITKHQFRSGHHLTFLVQKAAGNCEWLDDKDVEEKLKEEYKIKVLNLPRFADIPRPERTHNKSQSQHQIPPSRSYNDDRDDSTASESSRSPSPELSSTRNPAVRQPSNQRPSGAFHMVLPDGTVLRPT